MASVDVITVGGDKARGVNVAEAVGKGQRNREEDLVLIRTILRLLTEGYGPAYIGLRSMTEVPTTITIAKGIVFDNKDDTAIRSYQSKYFAEGILLKVDGIVHPASYKGRIIDPKDPRRMTIHLMHDQLVDAALMFGWEDYMDKIVSTTPLLKPFLK
jgi:hypothetical protein